MSRTSARSDGVRSPNISKLGFPIATFTVSPPAQAAEMGAHSGSLGSTSVNHIPTLSDHSVVTENPEGSSGSRQSLTNADSA